MKYFYEKSSENHYRVGYEIKKNIFSKKNKDGKIEIIENPLLGKMFTLDGFIHFTEKYEFIFSEMMIHSIMFSHPRPEKVLIISDFDRGILKEVLKHKSVNETYLISENKDAYEAIENNFSDLKLKEISSNPKVKVIFDDSIKYIENFEDYFDVVIVDSKNHKFKNKDFFKAILKSLTKEGMFSLYSGSFMENAENIKNDCKLLKTIFRYKTLIRIPAIEQIFSDSCIILSSKKINVSEINLRALTTRFKQFRESKNLKYYSPDIHLSSMILPKFYEKEIK